MRLMLGRSQVVSGHSKLACPTGSMAPPQDNIKRPSGILVAGSTLGGHARVWGAPTRNKGKNQTGSYSDRATCQGSWWCPGPRGTA